MKPTKEDWAILEQYGVTPDNLSVDGLLDLEDTAITALPDNISIGGSLDLEGTAITALPDNISIGGSLYLEGTAITALHEDDRGYRLDRAGDRYIAGCRNFSVDEALAHWSGEAYPDKERGAGFCNAIIAEEKRRKEMECEA